MMTKIWVLKTQNLQMKTLNKCTGTLPQMKALRTISGKVYSVMWQSAMGKKIPTFCFWATRGAVNDLFSIRQTPSTF
jgi:hypothetical protein